ncbi:serine/threonine-protein kinase, partial [Streptomyces sp. T-3]|nr:serine/threonine-protein kinase [Streptomyces sp. T-3]
MGVVYLARSSTGRQVALKVVHQQFAEDEEFRIRFRQEVAAARRVSGAFTAAVVDADPEAVRPWMATAFIEGRTLAERVQHEGAVRGRELRQLAVGLAEALKDIHRAGVVHRDLKPANIVLSGEGPRVIDFGISRAADNQTLTMTGRVMGTPPFMSPEQLQSPRDVGPESDVFSLAAVLVFAAAGRGPFDADSPYLTAYQVVHEAPSLDGVPAGLRAAVEPCLAKEPERRTELGALLGLLRELPDHDAPGEARRTEAAYIETVLDGRRTVLDGPRPDPATAPAEGRQPPRKRKALIAAL